MPTTVERAMSSGFALDAGRAGDRTDAASLLSRERQQ
jgi:hypothetical protein